MKIKKKIWREKLVSLVNVFSIKKNQTFTKLKNCSQQRNRFKIS